MGGHYERGLLRQVEDLTLENERLREENKRLRRENSRLRKENTQLKRRLENLEELVEQGEAEHIIVSDVAEGEAYVSDWTVNIKVVTVYTEHRRVPGAPPKIEYGPQVKALAVYLNVVGLIAFKQLAQFFCDLTHTLVVVSKRTLSGFIHSAAEQVIWKDMCRTCSMDESCMWMRRRSR